MTSGRQPAAALLTLLFAAAIFVSAPIATSPSGSSALSLLTVAALFSSCGLAALALAGAFLAARPVPEALALAPGRLQLRSVLGLACGMVALSHLLDVALRAAGLFDGSVLDQIESSLQSASSAGVAFALLGLAAAPGVGEELLFRGLALHALERRLGSAAALVLSSIAFGAVHGDFAQALGAALLGLYLGGVAIAAGSVRPAIACHLLNNAVAVAAGASSDDSLASAAPWWLHAAALVILGFALLELGRALRTARAAPGPASERDDPQCSEPPAP